MIKYKFKEFIYNLESNKIQVVVAHHEFRNKWVLKKYEFDPTNEMMDIDYYVNKVTEIIESEIKK